MYKRYETIFDGNINDVYKLIDNPTSEKIYDKYLDHKTELKKINDEISI